MVFIWEYHLYNRIRFIYFKQNILDCNMDYCYFIVYRYEERRNKRSDAEYREWETMNLETHIITIYALIGGIIGYLWIENLVGIAGMATIFICLYNLTTCFTSYKSKDISPIDKPKSIGSSNIGRSSK